MENDDFTMSNGRKFASCERRYYCCVVIVVIVFVVVVVIVICCRGMSFDRQICRSAANLLNSLISALSSMKRTKVSIFNEKVLAFNMLS